MRGRRFFFIGTEAELIKVFPVLEECRKRKLDYEVIASGQNDIVHSVILTKTGCARHVLELSREADIKKSARGLAYWFFSTYRRAGKKILHAFPDTDFKKSSMIVHGDTVSALMGAWIGRNLGMKVCHIEAGLRSHHLLNPFPEEIDRLLTGRLARVHFAPGKEAVRNLKKAKGKVVDTRHNTLIDSLQYSLAVPAGKKIESLLCSTYFVFVMHRQENLARRPFLESVIKNVCSISQNMKCMFVLHEITKNSLEHFHLMQTVRACPNITLLPRTDYFDFMKLLSHAEFVITDGGSNQEELFYMGKPCLIMRRTTERSEGIGKNAVLYGGRLDAMHEFADRHACMKQNAVAAKIRPSAVIADELERL